jgi:Protein of unknown function (DUF4232)
VSACKTTDLDAATGGSNGAAGSIYVAINLTNVGGATCTLYGYPGVSLVDSSATQIGAAATRSQLHTAALVTLAPGAKANFTLQIGEAVNYPSGTCKPTQGADLKIYPPNQTQALELPNKSMGCASKSVDLLFVSAVVAGAASAS